MEILRSGEISLRGLQEEDAPLLLKWLTNPRVLEYYEGRDSGFDLDRIREKFFNREEELTPCIIQYQSLPIGYLQFYPVLGEGQREYGLLPTDAVLYATDQFIGETAYWNRGIGQALMKAVTDYLFDEQSADSVILDPQCRNKRAIACYEKVGFRKIKLLPKHELHEGVMEDCWLMEIQNNNLMEDKKMEFSWLNESSVREEEGTLILHAPAMTDFFNYGENLDLTGLPEESVQNAPYYYTHLEGDFVLRVKVSLEFKADYDACALLLMKDKLNWGKLCFEKSDFDTTAVVSVVTKVHSDDANGVNVSQDAIWLQAVRVNNYFAFHYSLDGETYYMTRLFYMPTREPLMVGLVAQSPTGQGGPRFFSHLSIEKKTVENLRKGV